VLHLTLSSKEFPTIFASVAAAHASGVTILFKG
jgi:hypothetical protein